MPFNPDQNKLSYEIDKKALSFKPDSLESFNQCFAQIFPSHLSDFKIVVLTFNGRLVMMGALWIESKLRDEQKHRKSKK